MEEEWKPVPNFTSLEEDYLVSNLGNIKNVYTNKILKTLKLNNGYEQVYLYGLGVNGKNYYVDRLVAWAFIDNPKGFKKVQHINGIKNDNRAENLRWDNLSNEEKANNHLKSISVPIIQRDKDYNFIKRFDSIKQAAEELGLCARSISEYLRDRLHHRRPGGFYFEYAIDEVNNEENN